jgi:16S rRNA (guanine966-N2)-methyltransferase
LPVLAESGLRPTADRVRETLFNWLQHRVAGARVLDGFAGSGALGFEAASRGAAQVVCVEHSGAAAANLREQAARLKVANLTVVQADALLWLEGVAGSERFDLVFLDPPYASRHWQGLWSVLPAVLADNARVYVELSATAQLEIPESFHVLKQGQTRESRHLLLQWQ